MPNAKPRAERGRRGRGHAPPLGDPTAAWPDAVAADVGPGEPTALHAQRLETVHQALRAAGARTVADLGCGDGAFVRRLLADARIERIVALDRDAAALARLERSVDRAALATGRLTLLHGSFAAAHRALAGVHAVAMVETIEHLAPGELSALEHQVFTALRPASVVITTPNVECNELLGVPPGRLREPGHRFEWPRSRFSAWAHGVASRRGYAVRIAGIGPEDARLGCPTQWALFERRDTAHQDEHDPDEAGIAPR
jgi:small RNA 2'-O-methyltransferase